jgi:hypothetical protein
MRFETKFDRWLVIVLVFTACVTFSVPASLLLTPGPHPTPQTLAACFVPVLWLVVLSGTLPQYYEVRADGLFIRQGWKKSLIPYASLLEVTPQSDSRSAAVFSIDRILIVTRNGKRLVIAVAEDDRFFSELAKRCPQLERRAFGLGTPLSPPPIG